MSEDERARAVAAIEARRAARGLADPLNRLSAYIARAVANGEEVAIEQRPEK